MPRTKQYSTNAERQRAYRARKRPSYFTPEKSALEKLVSAIREASELGDAEASHLAKMSDEGIVLEIAMFWQTRADALSLAKFECLIERGF